MASSASPKLKSRIHCSDKDIISSIPDAILSHVLSFLPTKYAVLTSILSTRWRHVWTLVPVLMFDDSVNQNSENLFSNVSFMNFMDRVLIHHGMNTSIIKFHLSCRLEYDFSYFSTWISHVIEQGVRDVNLSYHSPTGYYVDLPRSLFTCKMLEVLKLNVDFHIHIPDNVCLPSLRVLHLISLRFMRDSSFENLIRSCPVLEELVIYRDEFDSLENLKICSSSLKSLKIHTEERRCSWYECSVAIDAPFLGYLDIIDHTSGAYEVSKLSYVVKANINIWLSFEEEILVEEEEIPEEFGIHVLQLFRRICDVKHLTLTTRTFASICCKTHRVPTFCNLTHLEVKVQLGGWDFLPELFQFMPEVTDLVIEKLCRNCCKKSWHMPDSMVKCLSRLEKIKFRRFNGCLHEMEFARYFLENSMLLKKMTFCSRDMGQKAQWLALKKLKGFPKGSRICVLVFS